MKENLENQEFKLINWKSIVIGSTIIFIGFLIAFGGSFLRIVLNLSSDLDLFFLIIVILTPIIVGFIIAYMNKPIYTAGIKNGFLATLIGFIIFNLFIFFIGIFRGVHYTNIGYIIYGRILLFMVVLIPVFLSSFIGISIKKLKIRINNRQIKT